MQSQEPMFLCVEDDPPSREVIGILLTEVMGFSNVTIFEDSANITDRVAALPAVPDVVLLDIHMQPYDGYQVLEMLRNMDAFRHTFIVALTAGVTVTDVHGLRAAGFNGLIGKPIQQRYFPGFLSRILAGEEVWTLP
jgi:two-component system, cell cycle response regulator DivK